MTRKARLYLTEADHHSVKNRPNPLSAEALRAYIIQHSLFFDTLLVGDSQLNNNKTLRQLIMRRGSHADFPKEVLRDLDVLIESGFLLPALRSDVDSLSELRKIQRKKKVADVPTEAYTRFVDEMLNGRKVAYNVSEVSNNFKRRALSVFSDSNQSTSVLSQTTKQKVRAFIKTQKVLYFNDLRTWMRTLLSEGGLTSRESIAIDKAIASCYMYNVPISIGTNLDIAIPKARNPYPLNIRLGAANTSKQVLRQAKRNNKKWELPPIVLSKRFLARIPADAMLIIKGSKELKRRPTELHTKVVTQLERFRNGGRLNEDNFRADLYSYIKEIDLIVSSLLLRRDRNEYVERKNKQKRGVFFQFVKDLGWTALGFIPGIGSGFTALHIGSSLFDDLRGVARQEDFLDGYLLGKQIGRQQAGEDLLLE